MTNAEWAAWVSAGAAVVQAVSAGLAIWYSGKLARDAATREIAAAEASRLREEEADLRAAQRIMAADEAAIERQQTEERQRHNAPLLLAIDLATAAIEELEEERHRVGEIGQDRWDNMTSINETDRAELLEQQGPGLVQRVADATAALSLNNVLVRLAPMNRNNILHARQMVRTLDQKIAGGRLAIADLREQVRHPA